MKINIISLILGDFEDYNDQYKTFNRMLMRDSSAICDHCVRSFISFKKFDCLRLNLICTKHPRKEFRRFGTVLEIDVLFTTDYFLFNDRQKEQYLFQLIENNLNNIFIQRNWDVSLLQCLNDFRKNDYISFFATKLKCQSNSLHAVLYCKQSLCSAVFCVCIFRKKQLIETIQLFESEPNVFDYDRFLGKIMWDCSNNILLYSKNGDVVAQGKVHNTGDGLKS